MSIRAIGMSLGGSIPPQGARRIALTDTEFEQYRARKAINISTLKSMRISPLHYQHARKTVVEDRPRMGMGRAVHTAVLEPHLFPSLYVIYDGDRRGNAWKDFKAANAKTTILRVDEMEKVRGAAEAIQAHPVARNTLSRENALIERAIEWTDLETGLRCKGRPDHVKGYISDLKTVPTVDERKFRADAARNGFYLQCAFYRRGYRALTKYDLPCAIVAVEMDPPHDVGVFEVDPVSLARADEQITRLLQRVAECEKSGVWPGRHPTARTLTAPEWAHREDEDEQQREAA
jgi:hypothetical protein